MIAPGRTRSRIRTARAAAVLVLLPLASGCVAVGAIPIAIGGALYARNEARIRAATPVPAQPSRAGPAAEGASAESRVQITALTELPPPSGASVPASVSGLDEGWQRFFDYALDQRQRLLGDEPVESALLASGSSLESANRRPCGSRRPAVIVDLDHEAQPFAPAQLEPGAPELAQQLVRLRTAGIVVLWIGQVPAAGALEVANALRMSGLDPAGQDQLLLIRGGEDRKQLLREQANEDVCILAIAGDLRSDFDELFDYLRNPAGAAALYPLMGSGWFLVPPLSGTPASATEE